MSGNPTDGTQDLPLPSLTTLGTTVTALTAKIPTIGTHVKAASLSVTIATDQGAIPISFTEEAGLATETTLAALSAKILAGAVPAAGLANSSIGAIGTRAFFYNGTTWDPAVSG